MPHALTPLEVPPSEGTGWVRYHDTRPATGIPGIAITWRDPQAGLMWATVMDRLVLGSVAALGRFVPSPGRLADHLRHVQVDLTCCAVGEPRALDLVLPGPASDPLAPFASGLPPVPVRSALARAAVADAGLPRAMADALHACLDHGIVLKDSLVPLRDLSGKACWPALGILARHPGFTRLLLAAGLTDILAADEPLRAARERWPDLSRAHVGLAGTSAFEGQPAPEQMTMAALADLLLSTPASMWPDTPADWHALRCCAEAYAGYVHPGSRTLGREAIASLMAMPRGGWADHLARLAKAAGVPLGDPRGDRVRGTLLQHHGLSCWDPVASLSRQVVLPVMASVAIAEGRVADGDGAEAERCVALAVDGTAPAPPASTAAASRLLYGGKSLPAIMEVSARWHARQDAMATQIRGSGDFAWPPLFEGEFRRGDLGVVAIREASALRAEGARGPDADGVGGMDHCVATRLPDCIAGRAHVLSVRRLMPDGGSARVSTCELRVDGVGPDGPALRVVQHRGPANSPPPFEAIEAIQSLVDVLGTGLLVAVPEAVSPPRRQAIGPITLDCGYDWRDPDALAVSVRAWEPFLPRWARGLGPRGLHAAMAERGVVGAPGAAGTG